MALRINIDINKLTEFNSQGLTTTQIAKQFNVSRDFIRIKLLKNNLKPNKPLPRKLSKEEKKQISIKRKEYLRKNPDKHPWRNNNKFKSKPCEKFKEWMNSKNIAFISEYSEHGVDDRYFSIDIALPDKMIAIEINGNQHYNSDGTLKDYYKEREKLLEMKGWKVYQIHYSICYKIEKLEKLFLDLTTNSKVNFDYANYIKPEKNKNSCKDCEKEILKTSVRCNKCAHNLKTLIPDKSILIELIENYTKNDICKKFNISYTTLRKWFKKYDIL